MSTDRDQDEPGVDASADTVAGAGGSDRSPSQQMLHDDVKAALFEGARPRDGYDSGMVLGGRWRIVGLIGRGGMGEVYRAVDLELGEDVAIKFLPRAYASNPQLRSRFVNEVRIARQITHPSVCRVHDIGEADGRYFLSMELIDGEDLSSLLRRIGRLPQEKALELAQQLCAGLAALHEKGVLHRDLKPSNVMIDGEGRLKLADFGLAAVEAELRPEELRDGTPAYMAPEQAAGKEVTARSDIFALGLVLYELIAGRHAYATGTDATGRPRIDRGSTPVSIATHVRGLPPELDDVIRACIDPDPTARPSSVLEVAAALPGGDPVAAAIAAGRAPSVEAVAGAKLVGTLPASIAYACAGFIALAVLLFAAAAPMWSMLSRARQDLGVEVLTHRAREALDAAGHTTPRDDFVVELGVDHEWLDWADAGQDDAPPLLFVYRESPEDLVAYGPTATIHDPPMLRPGDARVVIDGSGTLRSLKIVPPDHLSASDAPADFAPLLRLAGLDPDALVQTEPLTTPPVWADELRAWTGTIVDTGTEVTVEAAAAGGRPVRLVVHPPWDPVPEVGQAADDRPPEWLMYAVAAVVLVFAAAVVALARRSIRRGEADLRGALRVSAAVALLVAAGTLLRGHHAGPVGELSLSSWATHNALFLGGLTFLFYVIVEPYGRRYLPGTMVAWTRLVRGRWRDPMIAREVLVGVAVAISLVWLVVAKFALLDSGGDRFAQFTALYGTRHALGTVVECVWTAVFGILQYFVLYLLVTMLVRGKSRVAMVVVALLWAAVEFHMPDANSGVPTIVAMTAIALVFGALVVFVTRFGLLAAASMQLATNLLLRVPVTLEFDAWYGSFGLITFLGIGALTLFGLRCVRQRGAALPV